MYRLAFFFLSVLCIPFAVAFGLGAVISCAERGPDFTNFSYLVICLYFVGWGLLLLKLSTPRHYP